MSFKFNPKRSFIRGRRDDPLDELLALWSKEERFVITRNTAQLGNSWEFAVLIPFYLRDIEERTKSTSFTVNLALEIFKEMPNGMAAEPLLKTILDMATRAKGRGAGTNIQEMNEAILDVYFYAPLGSNLEKRALALVPVSQEYSEQIKKIRSQKNSSAGTGRNLLTYQKQPRPAGQ